MKVMLTGASGLIGSALAAFWRAAGHTVGTVVRGRSAGRSGELVWDLNHGLADPNLWEGWDVLVHLAGETLMQRWTAEHKASIRSSRVEGTRCLWHALARLHAPPPLLISASAIGYYGDRGETPLTEVSPPGSGFLAEVCTAWEEAARIEVPAGSRVVHLRFGLVLSRKGGALKTMLPFFKCGLGGRIGSGRQMVSWITLEDVIRAIDFIRQQPGCSGPFNIVAPQPVSQAELAQQLARQLHRPALVPLPAWLVRLSLGELGRELLLSSQRVIPQRLEQAGFLFHHPHLASAWRYVL